MKIIPTETIYEIKACADIWLESSFLAHHFISPDFWKDNYSNMLEQYLPSSDTYLAKQQNTITGFAAIYQGTLAALFVLPEWWGKGTGSLLLDHVQALHERLELTVYQKNIRAVKFYLRHGFTIQQEQTCFHTHEHELLMFWDRRTDFSK